MEQSKLISCGHPAAERFSAGDERGMRQQAPHLGHRSANGGMGKPGRIRPLAAPFHVRELVTQCGDAAPP